MSKTIHEINPDIDWGDGKSQLLFCRHCETRTRHITPFFGYPFRCVVNHGGSTLCKGCGAYVTYIAKVVVKSKHEDQCFCELCSQPDSPEKEKALLERRELLEKEKSKPINLNDPVSIARALGASSFR